ncbi:MAG: Cys-tRNA(Pro) deacylase [Syntrophomonadaceae bacterium]|jgi:Cys-tRNA(Pro)/Cys-tRNA(Cys) deacylase|nr:Cys-tRNA(Pro) deacylase [Syntrophomonadaceae bacterium]
MIKTNAVRLLESQGINIKTRDYIVDENDLSGEHVAEQLGIPAEQVFKTLVLKGENNGYFVCCIPSNFEVDLKKAARAINDKKADMIHVKDLQRITGYIRGGCSPIGMKKIFPTFIDETALLFDEICVSAGVRGTMIIIAPQDLIEYTNAVLFDLLKI